MATTFSPRGAERCQAFAAAAGILTSLMGAAVLLGWQADLDGLKRLAPTPIAMNPLSAVGFVLAGWALWLHRAGPARGRPWPVAQGLALLVATFGALRLVEYLLGWGPHLDQAFFPAELARSVPPNRMAPNTACAFVLLGVSFLLVHAEGRRQWFAQGAAIAAWVLAFVPTIGYLYRAAAFTRFGEDFAPMPLNTALAVMLVASGRLCVQADRALMGRLTGDRLGDRTLRRLLPAVVLIPLVTGQLRLLGGPAWAYDDANGTALIVTGTILLGAAVLWWQAGSLDHLERALHEAETRLHAVVETSPAQIIIRDREGRYLLANPAAAEAIGRPLADIVGHRDLEWFDQEVAARVLESDRRVADSGVPATYEIAVRFQGHEERTFLSTKYPYRSADGAVLGVIAISRDVTDVKRLEAALRENQGQMAAVLENSPVFLFDLDAAGLVRLAQGHGLAALHLRTDDLVGKAIEEAFAAYPAFVAGFHRAMAGEAFREQVVAADVAFDVWFTPVRGPGEACIVGVIGVATDVTVRRDLEDRLRAQYERLKELDTLKTDFINAISHDLRSPLTAILGYAEFLEDGVGGPLSPLQGEYVGQIERSSKRLESLVDDLLDAARLDAGTFSLQLEATDLARKVREGIESFEPLAAQRKLAIFAALPDEAITLALDPHRIERVLSNLIGNAVKFTPPGGRIEVRARREEDHVVVEVEDSGIGIAPEDVPRLFQRFSQLEAGARTKAGTGLGLWISRFLVEAHGGTIGVRSEPGRGSTFWFRLPMAPPSRGDEG